MKLTKNIITTLVLAFFAMTAMAGPGDAFENKNVSFKLSTLSAAENVASLSYDDINENFRIEMNDKVDWVEIRDSFGELVFGLPIGADAVNLDLEDLKRGSYTINIFMEGDYVPVATKLTKKR